MSDFFEHKDTLDGYTGIPELRRLAWLLRELRLEVDSLNSKAIPYSVEVEFKEILSIN